MIATVTLNPSLDEWIALPSLRLGALNRAAQFVRYPGGKGINVSRVVHELGGRTLALALAGGDDGLILRGLLTRLSLPHAFVTIPGSTRNNYKIHTTRPRALTEINTAGPRVFRTHLRRLHRRLLRHARVIRCVVYSGSLPPGAPASIYQRWLRAVQRRGIAAVLDASGATLRQGLAARPWLIKPNRQEAEEVLGRRLRGRHALVQAARQLVREGAQLAILSVGEDGALLASADTGAVWWAHPPAVRVDSAVGSGDALVGGFLVGWTRRQRLLEAFRLGVACGTATAMTPGTELCHRKDVERLLPRVTVRRVD